MKELDNEDESNVEEGVEEDGELIDVFVVGDGFVVGDVFVEGDGELVDGLEILVMFGSVNEKCSIYVPL